MRLLMSLGKYLWSETEEGVYSHIPAGTEAHFDKMDVTVESNYPWDGRVTYHITGKQRKRLSWESISHPGYARVLFRYV